MPLFMTENKEKMGAPWWQPGLILSLKLSGWIAGPVLIAVLVGKKLDAKYGTEPWLFLLSVGIAFIFSIFGIIHDSLKEIRRIEKEVKEKKVNSDKRD